MTTLLTLHLFYLHKKRDINSFVVFNVDNLLMGFLHGETRRGLYLNDLVPPGTPVTARMFLRGGKPKKQCLDNTKLLSRQDNKYESVERELVGFIRRVGPGKTPSAQAVAYAESLGYSLMPDETYVRSFTKHVLRLRRKEQ